MKKSFNTLSFYRRDAAGHGRRRDNTSGYSDGEREIQLGL